MATDLLSTVVGKFEAEIKSRGTTSKSTVTQFCVVDGCDGNLIGYETAIDLGLLLIINSVSEPKVDNIIKDYKDCFEGPAEKYERQNCKTTC